MKTPMSPNADRRADRLAALWARAVGIHLPPDNDTPAPCPQRSDRPDSLT